MRRILPVIPLLLQVGGGLGCAPPASKPISPQSAVSAPPPFEVTIAPGSVRLDGETVGGTGAENLTKLDRLYAQLKAGRTLQEDRPAYALASVTTSVSQTSRASFTLRPTSAGTVPIWIPELALSNYKQLSHLHRMTRTRPPTLVGRTRHWS